jgi:membrane fusion protein, multidrug efflux system
MNTRYRRFRFGLSRVILLGIALLALLAAGWHFARGNPAVAAPVHPDDAVAVESALVQREDVPIYLEGLGTVQAYNTARITSRVDGQLEDLAFTEGQTVRKGEVLARIDSRPYQAAFDQAKATREKDVAQLANARRDLDRYLSLEPSHLASRQQIDTQKALVTQLEAQIQADQAAIDSARTQLAYTSIASPIDGRTGIRLVDAGNNVHAADATGIVVVTQVQPISVVFTLPEESVGSVARALAAGSVEAAAMSRDGQTELDRGALALIDNQIDQTTGTARLKATFPNARNTLWPGEFVNVRVRVRTEQGALTMPSTALLNGPTGPFAYVITGDSRVETHNLRTEGQVGDRTVVTSGLAEGDRIVTSNQFRLQSGSKVELTPRTAAAARVAQFVRAVR